ncbi:6-phosphogluconolactonase [Afifella sp. YEN Y35]|uniref:6-phosphogluconolactonase n=1 Tax=Afifella sp. YEN Y35 TaxID=3388337 RepID=UPI0039E0F672
MVHNWHNFEDRDALAESLADLTERTLAAGIAKNGVASLALSGGSTPKLFFEVLSQRPLAWEKVLVTLVDERWVPVEHERSNARLVAEHFGKGPAKAARFIPLYTGADTPEDGVGAATLATEALPETFDVVVMGMGSDGHTASWFPGGDNLAAAIDPAQDLPLLPMRAEAAGEPRITFTLPRLLSVKTLILHIEGEEKRAVLDKARLDGDIEEMPIRAILRQDRVPTEIFYAP